jgi:hypothetical protein
MVSRGSLGGPENGAFVLYHDDGFVRRVALMLLFAIVATWVIASFPLAILVGTLLSRRPALVVVHRGPVGNRRALGR